MQTEEERYDVRATVDTSGASVTFLPQELSRRISEDLRVLIKIVLLVGLLPFFLMVAYWQFKKMPDTTLLIDLDPFTAVGAQSPVPSAHIRIENRGNRIDKNVYIKLQAPPISSVVIDNPQRVQINPTAGLELVLGELLPHEVRTVLVSIVIDPDRPNNWSVLMRSDNYPTERQTHWYPTTRDAYLVREDKWTGYGVDITSIGLGITVGPEHKTSEQKKAQ